MGTALYIFLLQHSISWAVVVSAPFAEYQVTGTAPYEIATNSAYTPEKQERMLSDAAAKRLRQGDRGRIDLAADNNNNNNTDVERRCSTLAPESHVPSCALHTVLHHHAHRTTCTYSREQVAHTMSNLADNRATYNTALHALPGTTRHMTWTLFVLAYPVAGYIPMSTTMRGHFTELLDTAHSILGRYIPLHIRIPPVPSLFHKE